MSTTFPAWLKNQIKEHGVSQAEFSRRSNLSPSQVARLLSGERNPGEDSLRAIADTLGIPIEAVYRAAGRLPSKPKENIETEELLFLWDQLSTADKIEMKEFIKIKLGHKGAVSKKKTALSV
jgi:transcriptional regulator with XRE-family HTH domain